MSEPKKTIEDLREVLFDTIAAVKEGKMEIDRAKTISDLAQVMVNTAKAEVEYARATGATGSRFLEMAPIRTPQGALPDESTPAQGGVRRYVDGRRVA